jgi:hypothetical protein
LAVELATAYFTFLPSMAGTAAAAAPGLKALEGQAAVSGARSGALMGGALAGGIGKFVPVIGGVLAGIGIADFFGDAVSAASDLNESANAIKVSFGDAAGEVDKLGQTAATRLGLSNNDFNALAVRFSSFSKTIAGKGGDVAATLDELTTRGADFASVYNIEASDALALFQSGLAGESEPLRKYGIDISAATVANTAYRLGIAENGKELTEQQKVQARYAAILEQTSAVEGDRANTADQFANKTRENAALLQDALAKVGEALLPAATAFAQWMGSPENIDRLGRLTDLMVTAEPAVSGIADALIAIADLKFQELSDIIAMLDAMKDGKVTLQEVSKALGGFAPATRNAVVGISNFVAGIVNSLVDAANGVASAVAAVFNAMGAVTGNSISFNTVPHMGTVSSSGAGKGQKGLKIPKQAAGGVTTAEGWSWVGEKGPELAFFPVGARVLPNDLSVAAVSGSSGGRFTGNLYLSSGEFMGAVDGRIQAASDDRALDLGTGGVA